MTSREFKQNRTIDLDRAAIAAGRWAAAIFLVCCIIALLLLPTGCGGSGGGSAPEPRYTVEVGAADVVAQARAWELCGGTVYCTYDLRSPFNTKAGFHAEGSESVAACYQQYGEFETVTTTSEIPYQCEAYE